MGTRFNGFWVSGDEFLFIAEFIGFNPLSVPSYMNLSNWHPRQLDIRDKR